MAKPLVCSLSLALPQFPDTNHQRGTNRTPTIESPNMLGSSCAFAFLLAPENPNPNRRARSQASSIRPLGPAPPVRKAWTFAKFSTFSDSLRKQNKKTCGLVPPTGGSWHLQWFFGLLRTNAENASRKNLPTDIWAQADKETWPTSNVCSFVLVWSHRNRLTFAKTSATSAFPGKR